MAILLNRHPVIALAAEFQHNLAIVVGINAYAHVHRLKTARPDAERLAHLLQDQRRDLHDRYEVIALYDEEASSSALSTLLFETVPARVRQLGKRTRVLFYFAGHGDAETSEDELTVKGFLFPQNAKAEDESTLLAMDKVQDALTGLDCQHVLLIVDCCSAGRLAMPETTRSALRPVPLYWDYLQRYVERKARQIITSVAHDQQALDVDPRYKLGVRDEGDGGNHSPFAQALFEALDPGSERVDPTHEAGRKGVVTATDLYLYIRETLYQQVGDSQTPGLWTVAEKGHDQGEYVFLLPGTRLELEPAPDLSKDEYNPWPGLVAYNQNQAELFAGRDQVIQGLTQRVETQPLVVVTGPSSAGKTSLVQAGLLPWLGEKAKGEQGATTKRWRILPPLSLGEMPLSTLGQFLAAQLSQTVTPAPADAFGRDPSDLAHLATSWLHDNPNQRLLLTLDTREVLFEEGNKEQRDRLWPLLMQVAQQDRLHVVLTVRSNHWSALPALPAEARFELAAMNREDLRQVVEQPAAARMVYLASKDLIDRLVDDTEGQPAALPLLSETLHRMYLRYAEGARQGLRTDRTLTQEDYKAVGGLGGVAACLAEAFYDQQPDDAHRLTMQHVLMRLVDMDEEGRCVRRRAQEWEFAYPDPQATARGQAVIAGLAERGLVVLGAAAKDQPYVELGHTDLTKDGQRLNEWLIDNEAEWELQRKLTAQVILWAPPDGTQDRKLLWDDNPRLPQLKAILWPSGDRLGSMPKTLGSVKQALWPNTETPSHTYWLNRAETDFLRASVALRASRRRWIVAITVTVMMVLLALALLANAQRIEATRQGALNLARQSMATTKTGRDPELSLLLAVEASRTQDSAGRSLWEVDQALRRALAIAPLATLRYESPKLQAPVVVFNRDGSRLVTASPAMRNGAPGTAHLLESDSGRELASFEGESEVGYFAFSPDGSRLVVAISDTLHLLDSGSGARLAVLRPGPKNSRQQTGSEGGDLAQHITFNPVGSNLAVAISNTVEIFDDRNGEPLAVLPEEFPIDRIVYSPDGAHLLTVISDTVHIWDLARSERRAILKHDQPVKEVVFSRDGSRLASTSGIADSLTAYLWNCETGEELREIASPYRSPEFSADGSRMIVVTQEGESPLVWLLDTESGQLLGRPLRHSFSLPHQPWPRFSADGSMLATAITNTVHIIDTRSLQEMPVIDHGEQVIDLEFSPVGRRLAVGGGRVVRVVNGKDSSVEAVLEHEFPVGGVRFSPDGINLATVDGNDSGVYLWGIAVGKEVRSLRTFGRIQNYAFNPDGSLFAVSEGTRVHVWDSASGKELTTLHHSNLIEELAFSPDGSRLVSGSTDGMARLWTRDGGVEPAIQELQETVVDILSVGMDYRLLTHSRDGKFHLRDIHGAELIAFEPDDGIEVIHSSVAGSRLVALKSKEPGTPSSSNTYYLLDGLTGERLNFLTVKYDAGPMAFDSSNTRLALLDKYADTIHLWDADTGDEVARLSGNGPISGLRFSPDGTAMVSYGGMGAWLWRSGAGEKIATLEERIVNDVVFSPDNSQLAVAVGNGEVDLWDGRGTEKLRTFSRSSPAQGVVFSPDSSFLASWSADYTVRVWSTSSQQEIAALQHPSGILSVAFSPGNARLATLAEDGNVHLWDTARWEEVGLIESVDSVKNDLMFSADGSQLITVSRSGAISRFRLDDAKELATTACSNLSRNLTQVEWATYLGDRQPYHPTCQQRASHETAIRAMLQESLSSAVDVEDALRRFSDGLALETLDPEVLTDTKRLAAQALYHESETLAQSDRLADALALVDEASRFDPSLDSLSAKTRLETYSAEGLMKVGNQLAALGDFEAALARYQAAKQLDPDLTFDPESVVASDAQAALSVQAAEMARSGHTSEAADLLMPLVTRFPNVEFTVPNYCGKPQGPCDLGQLISSGLEPTVKVKKLLASALGEQAQSLAANGKTEEARALFDQALELDPDLAGLLDPELEIVEATQKAADEYVRRGNNYHREGIYRRAVDEYDKAIELNYRMLDEAYFRRGFAYAKLENYDKAIADFKKAIELNPGVPGYYNGACWNGSLLGHASDVLVYCDMAVKLAPEDGNAFDNRGLARALLGDPRAIDDFEFAVRWALNTNYGQDFVETRRAWIAALREGTNPFDAAELERLRHE